MARVILPVPSVRLQSYTNNTKADEYCVSMPDTHVPLHRQDSGCAADWCVSGVDSAKIQIVVDPTT